MVRNADVPHAAPRQHLDSVELAVALGLRLGTGADAAAAEGVGQREGAEHEALRLALEEPFGLKVR